jgi:hypothetical protein
MKISRVRTLCASTAALLAAVAPITAAEAAPKSGEIVSRSHPRLIVLTDIGAEVDDQESLIRLLLYANEIDIEGLVATTSTFLREPRHFAPPFVRNSLRKNLPHEAIAEEIFAAFRTRRFRVLVDADPMPPTSHTVVSNPTQMAHSQPGAEHAEWLLG